MSRQDALTESATEQLAQAFQVVNLDIEGRVNRDDVPCKASARYQQSVERTDRIVPAGGERRLAELGGRVLAEAYLADRAGHLILGDGIAFANRPAKLPFELSAQPQDVALNGLPLSKSIENRVHNRET